MTFYAQSAANSDIRVASQVAMCTSNWLDECGYCDECKVESARINTHCMVCADPVDHHRMAYRKYGQTSRRHIGKLKCYRCVEKQTLTDPELSTEEAVSLYNSGHKTVYILVNWDDAYSKGIIERTAGMPIQFSKAIEQGVPWDIMRAWWSPYRGYTKTQD